MNTITKEDVRNAFINKNRKRNVLLYEFYKQDLFSKKLSAKFISEKISSDLGINISEQIIYKINGRIIKNLPAHQAQAPPPAANQTPAPSPDQKQNLQGKKGAEQQPSKDWEFKNADESPKKNPLEDAFKGL